MCVDGGVLVGILKVMLSVLKGMIACNYRMPIRGLFRRSMRQAWPISPLLCP